RHQPAMVSADIPHADVVAHDDDDVGLLRRGLRLGGKGNGEGGSQQKPGGERRESRSCRMSKGHLQPPLAEKFGRSRLMCAPAKPARYAIPAKMARGSRPGGTPQR